MIVIFFGVILCLIIIKYVIDIFIKWSEFKKIEKIIDRYNMEISNKNSRR